MKNLWNLANKAINAIAIVTLVLMLVSVFANAFMRYALNSGLAWSEEFARICFVWMVFLGIFIAAREKSHIIVDILVNAVSRPIRIVLLCLSTVISVVMMIEVVRGSWDLMLMTHAHRMPSTGLSSSWLYLPGVLVGALFILVIAWQIVVCCRQGDGDGQKGEGV